jgi:hypothetical protein
MLGKRLRIYRCSNVRSIILYVTAAIYSQNRAIAESIVSNGSHRQSKLILSNSRNNPAYKAIYEYRALDSAIFEKKFFSLKANEG